MSFKNWGIWQSSTFKNLKFLFSGAQRSQSVLVVGEGGTLAIEHLPMAMGFCSLIPRHISWIVEHKLKNRIKETGESVLEITERSYYPTDPFGIFTKSDIKNIQDLNQVALIRYIEKRNSLVSGTQEASNVKRNIIYTMLAIIGIIVVFSCF